MTTAAPSPSSAPAPGPREPSETFYFRARDGQRLYGELFAPPEPRGVVLILHGYAEHAGRYREVANVLYQLGIASLAYDMRGHGRSDGQRGLVRRFTDYLDDFDAALAQLDQVIEGRPGAGTLPLAVLGHSNGSLVTLRLLADPYRRPERVRCAVLSSPFLGLRLAVSPVKSLVGRVASVAMPSLSLPNDLVTEHLTSDPAKQHERRLDTLCHDVASARWYTEARATHEWVLEFAHRIEVPTLWLVSARDHIADPDATRRVHAHLAAPSEYHEFPDMEHEIFNELDRARPFELVRQFLREQFSL